MSWAEVRPRVRWLRASLLHQLVLRRNQIRRAVWRRIPGRAADETLARGVVHWASPSAPPDDLRVASPSHPAYVMRYDGPGTIEPKYGYLIGRRHALIETSVSNAFFAGDREFQHLIAFPAVSSYAAACVTRARQPIGDVALASAAWSDNYYHFLVDVVPKLALIIECGLADRPIVVGDSLFDRPYFQEVIGYPALRDLQFVAPKRRYLACSSAVIAAVPYSSTEGWKYRQALQLLGLPDRERQSERRIFLNRSASSGRTILNLDEILPPIRAHDFEVVDTDGWSVRDQATLFRDARFVVGIHGAGLTNMIFANGGRLDLLELNPPGAGGRGVYHDLCRALGYGHHSVEGIRDPHRLHWGESFRVDPGTFTETLSAMCAMGGAEQQGLTPQSSTSRSRRL